MDNRANKNLINHNNINNDAIINDQEPNLINQNNINEEETLDAPPSWELFVQNIQILKTQNTVDPAVISSLEKLYDALVESPQNTSVYVVANHYIGVTNRLTYNPTPTPQEVENDLRTLQKNLYSHRPLSKLIVGLIFGVVGAILGFAVGVFAGVVSTQGLAAVPAGIVGAMQGFTFGMKSGIAIGAVCGLFAASAGVLQGSIKHDVFKDQKKRQLAGIQEHIDTVEGKLTFNSRPKQA